MTKDFLHRFISQHTLAVIATVTEVGIPQSALVGFAVTPDLEIIFDTVTTSRKYKNLRKNPAISLVIGWDNEQRHNTKAPQKSQQAQNLKNCCRIISRRSQMGKKEEKHGKTLFILMSNPNG